MMSEELNSLTAKAIIGLIVLLIHIAAMYPVKRVLRLPVWWYLLGVCIAAVPFIADSMFPYFMPNDEKGMWPFWIWLILWFTCVMVISHKIEKLAFMFGRKSLFFAIFSTFPLISVPGGPISAFFLARAIKKRENMFGRVIQKSQNINSVS